MKPLRGGPKAAKEHYRTFDDQREHVLYFEPPLDDEVNPDVRDRLQDRALELPGPDLAAIKRWVAQAAETEPELGPQQSTAVIYWRCLWSRTAESAIAHALFPGPVDGQGFTELWMDTWNATLTDPANAAFLSELARRHRSDPFAAFSRMPADLAAATVLRLLSNAGGPQI